MKCRCNNPNDIGYKHYGALGIRVEWDSISEFRKDMFSSYERHVSKYGEKNTTIERIDSRKNYCKDNCRWATNKEQSRNTSNNFFVTYNGEKMCLKDASQKVGIPYKTLHMRISRGGYSFEEAINFEKNSIKIKRFFYNGKKYTLKELEEISKVPKKLISRRINELGWSVDKAIREVYGQRSIRGGGVFFEKCSNRFVAYINKDKIRYRKRFKTREEAEEYRKFLVKKFS